MAEYMKKTARKDAQQNNASPVQAKTNGIPNSVLNDVFAGKRHADSSMMGHSQNLAPSIAAKMSRAFGMDLTGMQVYQSDAMKGTGMQGMAQGNKVVLSSDVDLNTTAGQAVLGHEISHIHAQSQGIGMGHSGLYENAALEHQADTEGLLAAQGRSIYSDGMDAGIGMQYGLGMRGVEGLTPLGSGMSANAGAPMQASASKPSWLGGKKIEETQVIDGAPPDWYAKVMPTEDLIGQMRMNKGNKEYNAFPSWTEEEINKMEEEELQLDRAKVPLGIDVNPEGGLDELEKMSNEKHGGSVNLGSMNLGGGNAGPKNVEQNVEQNVGQNVEQNVPANNENTGVNNIVNNENVSENVNANFSANVSANKEEAVEEKDIPDVVDMSGKTKYTLPNQADVLLKGGITGDVTNPVEKWNKDNINNDVDDILWKILTSEGTGDSDQYFDKECENNITKVYNEKKADWEKAKRPDLVYIGNLLKEKMLLNTKKTRASKDDARKGVHSSSITKKQWDSYVESMDDLDTTFSLDKDMKEKAKKAHMSVFQKKQQEKTVLKERHKWEKYEAQLKKYRVREEEIEKIRWRYDDNEPIDGYVYVACKHAKTEKDSVNARKKDVETYFETQKIDEKEKADRIKRLQALIANYEEGRESEKIIENQNKQSDKNVYERSMAETKENGARYDADEKIGKENQKKAAARKKQLDKSLKSNKMDETVNKKLEKFLANMDANKLSDPKDELSEDEHDHIKDFIIHSAVQDRMESRDIRKGEQSFEWSDEEFEHNLVAYDAINDKEIRDALSLDIKEDEKYWQSDMLAMLKDKMKDTWSKQGCKLWGDQLEAYKTMTGKAHTKNDKGPKEATQAEKYFTGLRKQKALQSWANEIMMQKAVAEFEKRQSEIKEEEKTTSQKDYDKSISSDAYKNGDLKTKYDIIMGAVRDNKGIKKNMAIFRHLNIEKEEQERLKEEKRKKKERRDKTKTDLETTLWMYATAQKFLEDKKNGKLSKELMTEENEKKAQKIVDNFDTNAEDLFRLDMYSSWIE